MHLRLFALLTLSCAYGASHAYEASAPLDVDLSGRWNLNTTLSDDANALLLQRLEKQFQLERRRRAREEADSGDQTPLPESIPAPKASRVLAQLREVLGLSPTLEIRQADGGSKLAIDSEVSQRRFTAGSRSLVSMPEGELADSQVGWAGEWFVIERKVRRGPRVIERYRLLKKTGQLQASIAWSGGSEEILAGIKLNQVFDRGDGAVPPPPQDPSLGPVP